MNENNTEKLLKRLLQINQQIKEIISSRINDEGYTGNIEISIECNRGNISSYKAIAKQIFPEKKLF